MNKLLFDIYDSFLLLSKNGTCLNAGTLGNKKLFAVEDAIGKNIDEIIPEECQENILNLFNKVKKEEYYFNDIISWKCNNSVILIICEIYPIGENICCKFSNEKSNHDNFKLIETLYKSFDTNQLAIFCSRIDGTLLYANNSFKSFVNIPDNVLFNNTFRVYNYLTDINNEEEWQKRLDLVIHGKKNSFSIKYKLLNNKTIGGNILYTYTQINEKVIIWGFYENIDDNVYNNSKTINFINILNTILDNLPASVTIKEASGDFPYIYRNKESFNREKNIKINEHDYLGKNDFYYYPKGIAESTREEDLKVVETKKPVLKLIKDKNKAGKTIFLEKSKIYIEEENLKPIIITTEWDVTGRELTRIDLEKKKLEAEKSNKLKSAFIANMSHDIRTPLNAIQGFSEIIAFCDDKKEREEFYKIIKYNTEQLINFVNSILDFAKLESGFMDMKITEFELNSFCKNIFKSENILKPADVKFIYEEQDEPLMIKSDGSRLSQVLNNIIGNAFKFTDKGYVKFGYEKEGNLIKFHIKDNGEGIPADKLNKVFDRFEKLNSYKPGSGLGMSICKTIVEKLGGEIWLNSHIGEGSEFFFTIPVNSSLETPNNLK